MAKGSGKSGGGKGPAGAPKGPGGLPSKIHGKPSGKGRDNLPPGANK